ncbi:MAG: nucleotidyltransferase domain-containing protein [Egibacteraceae bacterium]
MGHLTVFTDGRWRGRTLREWLPDIVDEIVEAHHPLRIILFGSLARGEERRESDIDLVVVFDEAPREEKTQLMSAIYRTVGGKVPVDVIVTDPGEIARRGHLPGSILYPALREGVVVYDRAA